MSQECNSNSFVEAVKNIPGWVLDVLGYKDDAETARDESVAAKTASETARDESVAAKDIAVIQVDKIQTLNVASGQPGTNVLYDPSTNTLTIPLGADGAGDMNKAVYDTNASGVVDDAEKLSGVESSKYFNAHDALLIDADLADGNGTWGIVSPTQLHTPSESFWVLKQDKVNAGVPIYKLQIIESVLTGEKHTRYKYADDPWTDWKEVATVQKSMQKSVYDTTGSGVVDDAEKINGVTPDKIMIVNYPAIYDPDILTGAGIWLLPGNDGANSVPPEFSSVWMIIQHVTGSQEALGFEGQRYKRYKPLNGVWGSWVKHDILYSIGDGGLTEKNFTTAEKNKLAALDDVRFKGAFVSVTALQTAYPTASAGDYADVDPGAGSDAERYIWDATDASWIAQIGGSSALSDAQIKTQYEANADTNAFTDNEKIKLSVLSNYDDTAIQAEVTLNAAKNSYPSGDATKVSKAVVSDIAGITGGVALTNMVAISQANYDANSVTYDAMTDVAFFIV